MKIIADEKIPFLKGRPEEYGETRYCEPSSFSKEIVKDADVLLVRTRTQCGKELLEGSKVRLIASATIGMDHIDEEWCRSQGISVINAKGCNSAAVADYVWSFLLFNGFNPEGKKIGIIGHGNIGSIISRVARALKGEVMIYDPFKQRLNPENKEYVSLETLMTHSDAITMHVPYTVAGEFPTRQMIGAAELGLVKKGAFFLNAARGGVVDEKALTEIIAEKNILTAIDVWEKEPCINRELLLCSALSTPHIAGYSEPGKKKASDMIMNALKSFATSGHVEAYAGDEESEDFTLSISELKEQLKPVFDQLCRDSKMLKEFPYKFEKFRENYAYRNEILRSL